MMQMVRWVSLVLFGGVGFLYGFSGLIAPGWVVPLLWIVWLTHLFIVIRQWRRRQWVVVSAPLLSWFIWAAVILSGEAFLGWTA